MKRSLISQICPSIEHPPSLTDPAAFSSPHSWVYLGMTGHWSAQGWQGWADASESEGRGQVQGIKAPPNTTQQHNPGQPVSIPKKMSCYPEPAVPGWTFLGPSLSPGDPKDHAHFLHPLSPFCLCIPPVLALPPHLSSYICSNASISGLLSFRPSWINGQK